ncbi:MAG: EVE domain-containing protein [Bacteroidetes bacterium]|nr:EVE domain-containing protein [Bacteroidota bacterium]
MAYWLVKSDPEEYSWENLVADGKASWDGIRNYAARNHLKGMKKGDQVLVYHSGGISAVVGLATVSKEFYQDPTTKEDAWVSVELKAGKALKRPIPLFEIKKDARLKDMMLIKISRLSVMPVTEAEFELITKL